MKTALLLTLACSLCLTPALLWGADPPDKGKDLSADAELLAAAAPPVITLPRATRKEDSTARPSHPVPPTKPARKGVLVSARVVAGGKENQMFANQVGAYRRINVRPKEKASVDLAYPGGREGDVIIVSAMDGGRVNGKSGGDKLTLDKAGRVSFNFEVNEERGIYRLLVRRQQDSKVLEFWV